MGSCFEDKFEDSLRRKSFKYNQCDFASVGSGNLRKHLKIHSGVKSFNVIMPLSTPAIWRYIWKLSLEKKRKKWKQFDFAVVKSSNLIWEEVLIQEKNYSNATNMSMHLFTQAIWVDIWKLTLVIQVQPLWVYNLTIWDIETKIYKTDTETFLDQIFLERDWDFFCLKKFRDRLWGFIFNQNFRDQNFQYPYQYSQKMGKVLRPRSLETWCHTLAPLIAVTIYHYKDIINLVPICCVLITCCEAVF